MNLSIFKIEKTFLEDQKIKILTGKINSIIQFCIIPLDVPKGEEDCLYLNIYKLPSNDSELKPVMVFIHGGGFLEGSGNYVFDFYHIFSYKYLIAVHFCKSFENEF